MRQALFNILGARTPGARFLDIFAGTGLIGLEALSRGAASLTAIEQNRPLAANIKIAAQNLGYEAEIISGDFREALPTLEGRVFEIIFADPPYEAGFERQTLALVAKHHLLNEQGLVVIEHLSRNEVLYKELPFRQIDRRQYGQSAFSFYVLN
jgi:16S rRNA (guanine(966)-N(2))-methyltransferase RsmD